MIDIRVFGIVAEYGLGKERSMASIYGSTKVEDSFTTGFD
jgi:hypothetical protein